VARVHGKLSWSTDKPSPTEEAGYVIIISADAKDDNAKEDRTTPAATLSTVST
jgi:hypothetical protein